MVSTLEGCAEGCGWAAAILAALSWGTFAVPIKAAGNPTVDVNFFVMQSYKTIVCFITCWFVVLLGEPLRWTPWGIVSGLFWVPGATIGIFAIRTAGVAIAVGTWASIQVCTSFIFGIIIFQEQVKNRMHTAIAFVILMLGLAGMARFSDSSAPAGVSRSKGDEEGRHKHTPSASSISGHFPSTAATLTTSNIMTSPTVKRKVVKNIPGLPMAPRQLVRHQSSEEMEVQTTMETSSTNRTNNSAIAPLEMEEEALNQPLLQSQEEAPYSSEKDKEFQLHVFFGGKIVLTKRQLGILGAVVNGVWGGLNLIPLHYAQRDQGLSGASYVVSYATGSMLVCLAMWAGLYTSYLCQGKDMTEAYEQLPSWHVSELGVPGVAAGLLYSIGNFCSMLAVAYLGQGVGFSFCQAQLLVSGLWGVFYFGEIQGAQTIIKWFLCACVTIVGIILLSYQHESSGPLKH